MDTMENDSETPVHTIENSSADALDDSTTDFADRDDLEVSLGIDCEQQDFEGEEESEEEEKKRTGCCNGTFAYEGNKDALGFALDSVPRGVVTVGGAVFLSSALLHLAREAAGCETEIPEGETELPECNGRVYGIRPSSLLTLYVTVIGFIASFLMPVIGSIMDHTDHRRLVGRIAVGFMTTITLVQSFVGEKTWFPIACLQLVLAFFTFVHMCVTYAYLPEITDDKDKLMNYTAGFVIINNGTMVLFIIGIVAAATVSGISDDPVTTARVSQLTAFVLCAVCWGYAWTRLFSSKRASQELPQGESVVFKGLKHVWKTSKLISRSKDMAAIKWFLLSHSFSNAAALGLAATGITYLTEDLQFESSEVGIAVLILFTSAIPGSKLAVAVSRKLNPIRSLLLCLAVWIANTCLMAGVLTGPGQQIPTYFFSAIWGIAAGWKFPTEKVLYCAIIPKGQDAELMGIHVFAAQALTWFPPLVVTAMNEAGVSLRVGIFSLTAYFLVSVVFVLFMGSYEQAVAAGESKEHVLRGRTETVSSMGETQDGSVDSFSPRNRKSSIESIPEESIESIREEAGDDEV